ncbi:MAG: hypothetical protein V4618_11115 [Pseudomonadota bacterium]
MIGDWGSERHPSIGGGSYNLDSFVYSALLILLTGAWSFVALLVGLARRDPTLSGRAFILSGIGMVALVASCWLYGHNLT